MLNPYSRRLNVFLVGACTAIILVIVTTYRLDKPGLYYDELHQATGAFAYVGRPSAMFSLVPIAGLPVMNMPYTGAIKTAVYGMYMRSSGRPFSIVSWRSLGIIFCACGIVGFCLLVGARLPIAALLLFFGLLLSDTDFLLQSRHDWGPVALAFFLRMIFIGIWVRSSVDDREGRLAAPFLLGLVVGLSILEKLSSTVLLGPLVVILLSNASTRSVRAMVLAASGVCLGSLPVIAVNVYTFITSGSVLAISATDLSFGPSILKYASQYLALGNGGQERALILDVAPSVWSECLEGVAMATLIIVVCSVVFQRSRKDILHRVAGMAVVSYLAIGILLRLLPAATAENHWIIGTPFQYLAIALTVLSIWADASRSKVRRALLVASLGGLTLARAVALVSTSKAIRDDKYSGLFDPSLNQAAFFAARLPQNAVFIAADWGIATQVFCVANGRQDFVFEPYWDYRGNETLDPILDPPTRQFVVAAAFRPRSPVRPLATKRILEDLAGRPGWTEVALDPRITALPSVELHAFRRNPGFGREPAALPVGPDRQRNQLMKR